MLKKQYAFTLLEVIVAMALSGFALGAVFMLLGGSKELAWKANQQIGSVASLRAVVNEAQLHNNLGELTTPLQSNVQAEIEKLVGFPIRKTQPMRIALERVKLQHPEKGEMFSITRVRHLELPR